MGAPLPNLDEAAIAVVGLGYVGLPLAVAFGRVFPTTGYDIDATRIAALREGRDATLEVDPAAFAEAARLEFVSGREAIAGCNVYVVAVPTPIDADKNTDLSPLIEASRAIGGVLSRGDVVIYESTVYPGATEEVCVPELERVSGLRRDVDFSVGYSPERINPGDRQRRLEDIPKVTSGSTPEAADFVDALYRRILRAGTHRAPSLRVAEACKVIENTQRDVNIALMNEFAMILRRLGIDTHDVLEAAATKWNFLPFRPGLVGGHCIGVDPYHLIRKAQECGYEPEILLACRRINEAMGREVASEVTSLLAARGRAPAGARILVLGLSFKENCPDLRNTRVIDLVHAFEAGGATVDVHDPWADAAEALRDHGIALLGALPDDAEYDAVVVAVAHRQFAAMGAARLRRLGAKGAVLYDVKGILPKGAADGRL